MNETLLKKHIAIAPHMAPTDAVKLAFQSAFGCGHLLSDRESCAAYAAQEMKTVGERADVPAVTFIGGGLCRLDLSAPSVRALGAHCIADMMLLTNEWVLARSDNAERFEESLAQIAALSQAGETPFSVNELNEYLMAYRAKGCPPVSHSPAYREAYAPAYRVVLADFGVLLPVLHAITKREKTLVVIDGLCGSGKSTLAHWLGKMYDTEPIPMDDFFLPYELRTPKRLAQPGGNVHYERFAEEVITSLKQGGNVRWRRFDCQTGVLLLRERSLSPVMIVEGSYSHHPELRQAWDALDALCVFVQTDASEQLCRIAHRDPERLESFQNRWIPLEKTYFEAYDIKERAHMVLISQPWDAQSPFMAEGRHGA